MEIKWEIVEGAWYPPSEYRLQSVEVPDEKLQNCKSRTEVVDLIHEHVEEAFEEFKIYYKFDAAQIDQAWQIASSSSSD